MKGNVLLSILLLCFATQVCAQEKTFVYKRASGVIRLIHESDTISLLDYRRMKNATRERIVEMGEMTLILSVTKGKDRRQAITDENGVQYATVSLGTKDRYDVTLEDGTVLECTVTGRNWVYALGGKEVIKASLKKENGVRKIVIKGDDLASVAPALMLSCLERATDRYVSASNTTPMIISAVALALVRTATMNNSQPTY